MQILQILLIFEILQNGNCRHEGKGRGFANIQGTPDYKNVFQFIDWLKRKSGSSDTYSIECGYETGCLGYSLYHQLALIVETGDFKRFAKGNTYAAFLGLAPGESASGDKINRTGISKAGNTHLRCLLMTAICP